VLRVVDEAAGVLHFGAQGKALRHLVESGTVHLELPNSTATCQVKAVYCVDAANFKVKQAFPALTGLSRDQEAQILLNLGLETCDEQVMQVQAGDTWMEDQILEMGLELYKWSFDRMGYSLKQFRFVNARLSQRWLSHNADANEHIQWTQCIHHELKHEVGERIRVAVPLYSSAHWVLVVIDMESQAITGVRYYDSLTVWDDSCAELAQRFVRGVSLDDQYCLPLRCNKAFQPQGSSLCGFYALSWIEDEIREWCGEGPGAAGFPGLGVPGLRARLMTFSKQLRVEAVKLEEMRKAEVKKEKDQAAKVAAELQKKQKASQKGQASQAAAAIAVGLDEGHSFGLADLSDAAKDAIYKVVLKGLRVRARCNYQSGCSSCCVEKAEAYWLKKEAPAVGGKKGKATKQ
jgi:hypothetical protein